ncbi:MAG: hypothetical protein ACLRSW_05115 [Christensenellaceae bacterium]
MRTVSSRTEFLSAFPRCLLRKPSKNTTLSLQRPIRVEAYTLVQEMFNRIIVLLDEAKVEEGVPDYIKNLIEEWQQKFDLEANYKIAHLRGGKRGGDGMKVYLKYHGIGRFAEPAFSIADHALELDFEGIKGLSGEFIFALSDKQSDREESNAQGL